MKVVIIGAGNVASILGRLIKNAGYEVIQVVSRQIGHAALLADELGAEYTDQHGTLKMEGDIYLVAIADSAIHEMQNFFQLEGKLVVHTAGSVSIEALAKASGRHGVLYPLQSLRKENYHLYQDIPILVDGNTDETIAEIEQFALSISSCVERANDEARLKLHLAAVIVNNFTNHMYELAADFCEKSGVNFKMLQPLIEETALRLRDHSPADMQTGPAFRKDITTLDRHLRELAAYPKLRNVYLKMTDSIMNN